MTESKRGGKREGSGRKAKDPTTTINFRVPVDKVKYLKPLVSTYIKGLLSDTPVPATEAPIASQEVLPRKTNVKAKTQIFKNEAKAEPTMAELLKKMTKERKEPGG